MYIRCSDCLNSTWVEILDPEGGLVDTVDCDGCDRRYLLNPIEPLGATVREHYHRSLSYANEHDLDMGCAYSVLLGLMPLTQAEVLRHALTATAAPDPDETIDRELGLHEEEEQTTEHRGEAGQVVVERTERLPLIPDFDLGFSKAIAAGKLTVQQAIARGDRNAFANRLMRRHGLPQKLAYRVTDNRMRLRDALKLKEELEQERSERQRTSPRKETRPSGRRGATFLQKLAILGFAALLVVVVGWQAWYDETMEPEVGIAEATESRSWEPVETEPATPARDDGKPPLARATRVLSDPFGRVLQVVGPDPTTVLTAFCDASSSLLGLSPVEITSTVPAFQNARLGLFRDEADVETLYAIRIRRDSGSGRWIAGHGNTAVPVQAAPELPPDAIRIPIEP